MADLRKYYEQFDEAIKLRRFSEEAVLREKRDIIIDKMRERLKAIFEEREETPPSIEAFDQGSYAMGIGVKPLEGDYDIDEGIIFDIDKSDYPNPVVVKQWVYDAMYGHTNEVTIKRPCVTVQYSIEDEPVYHVDLPIYARDGSGSGGIYLARGKPSSPSDQKVWEISDPKGLCRIVDERWAGDDAKQFRRTIRYLKRWKDVNFLSNGNAAPVGIGITIAAYWWFQPMRELVDPLQNKYRYNDQKALRSFVGSMLNNCTQTYHNGEWANRLQVTLPVQPYDDPFLRMSNHQMENFEQKLNRLLSALEYAEDEEIDPVDACTELQKVFGDDFPVPYTDDTGRKKSPAILTSSTSA